MSSKRKGLAHLAIIMDGNGRWANQRHSPRLVGHKAGMDNIERITIAADQLGIKVLTLYAFSTENWGRPESEVKFLMGLPTKFFDHFMPKLMQHNVRVNIMGFLDQLPASTLAACQKAVEQTKNNTGLILNFAFNYGARKELVAGIREIASEVQLGKISLDSIDEQVVANHLMTSKFGEYQDPDLVIRTSGEQRISNFLLWQIAYSELAFSDKYWPDFTPDDLKRCIDEFNQRDRRFGKLDEMEE